MALKNEAKFLWSLVYQHSGQPGQVFADVDDLRALDKTFEAKGKMWFILSSVFTLLCLAGVILSIVLEGHPIGLALAGFAFVVAVPCVVMRLKLGKLNTEDRRYELLEGLLQLLQTDMAPESRMRVQLVLSRPNVKKKFSHNGESGAWTVKYYTDTWLKLEGRFLDGTAFLVEVVERFQERSRWATSRSGKKKRKTKTKSATVFRLRLKPKAKRYQHLSEIGANAQGALQLPEAVQTKGLQVEDGGLSVKVQSKADWQAGEGKQVVAMMFISLYQILNLSRAITKPGSQGSA